MGNGLEVTSFFTSNGSKVTQLLYKSYSPTTDYTWLLMKIYLCITQQQKILNLLYRMPSHPRLLRPWILLSGKEAKIYTYEETTFEMQHCCCLMSRIFHCVQFCRGTKSAINLTMNCVYLLCREKKLACHWKCSTSPLTVDLEHMNKSVVVIDMGEFFHDWST